MIFRMIQWKIPQTYDNWMTISDILQEKCDKFWNLDMCLSTKDSSVELGKLFTTNTFLVSFCSDTADNELSKNEIWRSPIRAGFAPEWI